ncbi:MAG: GAF domain-containing protein [Planctomycetota bacterium]
MILVCVGGFVLVGWLFGIEWLKSVHPRCVSMKANTAIAFLLMGLSLWLLHKKQAALWLRRMACVSSLAVGMIGLLTLIEYFFACDLGIDQLLFTEPPGTVGTIHPGRPAPNTALNFLLLGSALLLLGMESRRVHWAAQLLVLAAAVVSLFPVLGYAYGVTALYGIAAYTVMAPNTAVAFAVSCGGVLCLRPDRGLMLPITGETVGGLLARRLLPAAVLVPAVVGWLRLLGERNGLYDTEVGVALTAIVNILIFVALIFFYARQLHRTDADRKEAQEALSKSHAELEARVNKRTEEISAVNSALEKEINERKGAEERLRHLNAVLSAVRNVNQLITKEKDRRRLIEQACKLLVETRGYNDAWIALFDEKGGVKTWAEAGVGDAFSRMAEQMKQGNIPACTRKVLGSPETILTEAPASACSDCPLKDRYNGKAALSMRLEHAGRVYGLLSVSVPTAFDADKEEQRLFEEVAGDIAFALYAIEQGEKQRSAQQMIEELAKFPSENPNPVLRIAENGYIIYANVPGRRMLSTWQSRVGDPLPDGERRLAVKALGRGESQKTEVAVGDRVFSLVYAPIQEAGYVNIYGMDITDRKQAEEALRASMERYHSTLENMLEGCQIIGPDWRYLYVNDAAARQGRRTREELLGRTMMETYPGIERTDMFAALRRCIEERTPCHMENEFAYPGGDVGWFELHIQPVPEGAFVLSIDITDRKQAERELAIRNQIAEVFLARTDEEMYGEVLNVVLDVMDSKYGVFGYLDETGALVVPSMTRHIWNQCQIPDKKIVFPREMWGQSIWPRAIRQKKTLYTNEPSTLTPKGHIRITRNISVPIIHQGEVIGLIQVANKESDYTEEDIHLLETIGGYVAPILSARLQRDTALKNLERSADDLARSNRDLKESQAQLIQAEKLGALGVLTAGIAHELNNPFMAILNFIQYCRKHTPPFDKRHEVLADAETELRRCIGLVQDLLTYSRADGKGEESYQEIEGAEVLDRVLRLLSYRIEREGVAVERDIAGDAPKLRGNLNQIQQVFSNVILNALDALAQAKREEKRLRLGLRGNGGFIRIAVADNGVGIPRENLSKIFDPFFTTKPPGQGTGLGLSVSQNIVKAHGGRIACESEVGKGATFEILLPVAGDKKNEP